MSSPADHDRLRDRDEGDRSAVPRYFVDDGDALDGDQLVIRGPTARRLNRVMRVRRDDLVEIVHPPLGRQYKLRITRVTRDSVEGRIEHAHPLAAPAPPLVTICAALIRPQRFDFMVEKVTELGVAAIQPIWTERSMMRAEGLQRLARWRRLSTEAAEQSGRQTRPEVHAPRDFVDVVTAEMAPETVRLLASAVEPEQRVADLLEAGLPNDLQILVGPEGGLTPDEARLARSYRWRSITLGPRPLRAETASIVAVALAGEAIAAHRSG